MRVSERLLVRGKRINDGEWITGYCWIYMNRRNYPLVWYEKEPDLFVAEEIDPESMGQCTGLKERNGKLMYEGDIVRLLENSLPLKAGLYEVAYYMGSFMLDSPDDAYPLLQMSVDTGQIFTGGNVEEIITFEVLEIIGNVHE